MEPIIHGVVSHGKSFVSIEPIGYANGSIMNPGAV